MQHSKFLICAEGQSWRLCSHQIVFVVLVVWGTVPLSQIDFQRELKWKQPGQGVRLSPFVNNCFAAFRMGRHPFYRLGSLWKPICLVRSLFPQQQSKSFSRNKGEEHLFRKKHAWKQACRKRLLHAISQIIFAFPAGVGDHSQRCICIVLFCILFLKAISVTDTETYFGFHWHFFFVVSGFCLGAAAIKPETRLQYKCSGPACLGRDNIRRNCSLRSRIIHVLQQPGYRACNF